MTQYKLTEQEIRVLADRYANATMTHLASYYSSTPDQWVTDYMEKYNSVRNAIERYNQGLGG